MGTGPFAVPTFASLLECEHQVLALCTRPAVPQVGKHRAAPRPMFEFAQARGLPIIEPPSVNSPESQAQLRSFAADLFVVCDYGQILAPETLAFARLGGVNLHASLLPKYRGAAPINWALYHGESQTGVTVIHMTPRLDAGPCLVQRPTPILETDDAPELERRLAILGIPAVHEAIQMLLHWDGVEALGKLQDASLATRAPRLKKADGEVDWTRTARQIGNQIRAFKPWPGAFTHWLRPDLAPVRLILETARPQAGSPTQKAPGEVVSAERQGLQIAAGEGTLQIERIQPAGKRSMDVAEFLRGHAVQAGDRFGRV